MSDRTQDWLALQNPATTPVELARIAQDHPEFAQAVADHPNAYPGLKAQALQIAAQYAGRITAPPVGKGNAPQAHSSTTPGELAHRVNPTAAANDSSGGWSETLIRTGEPTTAVQTKKPQKPFAFIGLIAGVAIVAVVLIVVGNQSTTATSATTSSSPVASSEIASPDASAKETSPESETVDVTKFNISADATPQQLCDGYAKLRTEAIAGNLTPATFEDSVWNGNIPEDDYNKQQATALVTKLFDAQYMPGWRKDANLMAAFNYAVAANIERLERYDGTYPVDSFTCASENVISQTDTSTTIDVGLTEHYQSNSYDVSVGKLDGHNTVEEITFNKENGRSLISSWTGISG